MSQASANPSPEENEAIGLRKAVRLMVVLLVGFMVMYSTYYYINTANQYRSVVAFTQTMPDTRMMVHPGMAFTPSTNALFSLSTQIALQDNGKLRVPASLHWPALDSLAPQMAAALPERQHIRYAGVPQNPQMDSLTLELNKRFPRHPPAEYQAFTNAPLWLSYHFEQWAYLPEVRLNPSGMRFGDHAVRSLRFLPLVEKPEGMEPPERALSVLSAPGLQALRIDKPDKNTQFVLCKVKPEPTLWGTYEKCQRLIDQDRFSLASDTVPIEWPILDFNLIHSGKVAAAGSQDSIRQYFQCKMQLTSSEVAVGREKFYKVPDGETSRDFIFDGPFLLIGRKTGQSYPYLLAWIANREVLINQYE